MEQIKNSTQRIDDFTLCFPLGGIYKSKSKILEYLEHPSGIVIRIDVSPRPNKPTVIKNVIKISPGGIEQWCLFPPTTGGRDSFTGIHDGNTPDTFGAFSASCFYLEVNHTDGKVIEKIWTK